MATVRKTLITILTRGRSISSNSRSGRRQRRGESGYLRIQERLCSVHFQEVGRYAEN